MAAKKTSRVTKRSVIEIIPDPGWVKKQKSKMPRRFPPYRLKGMDPKSIDKRTIAKIRELTNQQLDELLAALGLERTTPNVWEHAFFLLSVIDYGVGHITWTPPRGPNRRAQKRTIAIDMELQAEVRHLMAQGCMETQALEKIAKDPEKCAKLKLKVDPTSERPDWERHFQTLQKRLRSIKKTPLILLRALAEGDFAVWLAALKEQIPLPPRKI